jgi:hypothetical protein
MYRVVIQYQNCFFDFTGDDSLIVHPEIETFLNAYQDWEKSNKEWWESFEYKSKKIIKRVTGSNRQGRFEYDDVVCEVKCLSRGDLRSEHDQMMDQRPEFGLRPTTWDYVISMEDALARWGKSAPAVAV